MFEFDSFERFQEVVKQYGLNLFLGAGFSVEAENIKKEKLKLGCEISEALCHTFSLKEQFKTKGLQFISGHLKKTRKGEFQDYLRSQYKVRNYDKLYDCIPQLPLKNIFTINIDDLIESIFNNYPEDKYVVDVKVYGKTESPGICFYKIHGSVNYLVEMEMLFGSSEIANAIFKDNAMHMAISNKIQSIPTLFWGTSFTDADIMQIVEPSNTVIKNASPKWVQVMPGEDYDLDADEYRIAGYNVIRSTTYELLEYLSKNINLFLEKGLSKDKDSELASFKNFSIKNILSRENPAPKIECFYLGDEPSWYHIINFQICRLSYFSKVINAIHKGQNLLICGPPGSGKTTLLMQVALENNQYSDSYYFPSLSEKQAELFVKKNRGSRRTIFLDNLSDNIDAYKHFLSDSSIQIICAERDYDYDQVRNHVRFEIDYIIDISDLGESDIQKVCDSMNKSTISFYQQKTSLFEICYKLWTGSSVEQKLREQVKRFEKDSKLLEFYTLLTYMRNTHIAASFDTLLAYYGDIEDFDYTDIYKYKEKIFTMIDDVNFKLDNVQDYFTLRSKIFADISLRVLPASIIAKVLLTFHKNVHSSAIPRYDVFIKRAYNADIAIKAFPKVADGRTFYEFILYKYRDTREVRFIDHQYAIYLWRLKRKDDAWKVIEEAYRLSSGKVYSINNTHAMILFDNNINRPEDEYGTVKKSLLQSFEVLEDCLKRDNRQTYHIQRYANQAIQYAKRYRDEGHDYLDKANDYIVNELNRQVYIPARFRSQLLRIKKDIVRFQDI